MYKRFGKIIDTGLKQTRNRITLRSWGVHLYVTFRTQEIGKALRGGRMWPILALHNLNMTQKKTTLFLFQKRKDKKMTFLLRGVAVSISVHT